MKNKKMLLFAGVLAAFLMLAVPFAIVTFDSDDSVADEVNVATIGDLGYTSLQTAFDEANNGDVVTLISDVTIGNNAAACIKIGGDKSVTLDLNGYSITQNVVDPGLSVAAIAIRPNTTLTLVDNSSDADGKISAKCTAVQLQGTLIFESGTIALDSEPTEADANKEVALGIWFYNPKGEYDSRLVMTGGLITFGQAQKEFNDAFAISIDEEYGTLEYLDCISASITGGSIEKNVWLDGISLEIDESVLSEDIVAKLGSGAYYTSILSAIEECNNDIITLMKNVDLTDTVTIGTGKIVTIYLNGYTVSSTSEISTSNRDAFLVKGTLTVFGEGKVTYEHLGTDMGWNYMSAVFDITAGGILNLKDGVVVENLGGTAMNIGVHLNNWGEVTLNMDNATVMAPYCAIRVFNSGFDMNNVYAEDSHIISSNRALWIHNYIDDLDKTKHPDDAVKARLNIDIEGTSNNVVGFIKYGFNGTESLDHYGTVNSSMNMPYDLTRDYFILNIAKDATVFFDEGRILTGTIVGPNGASMFLNNVVAGPGGATLTGGSIIAGGTLTSGSVTINTPDNVLDGTFDDVDIIANNVEVIINENVVFTNGTTVTLNDGASFSEDPVFEEGTSLTIKTTGAPDKTIVISETSKVSSTGQKRVGFTIDVLVFNGYAVPDQIMVFEGDLYFDYLYLIEVYGYTGYEPNYIWYTSSGEQIDDYTYVSSSDDYVRTGCNLVLPSTEPVEPESEGFSTADYATMAGIVIAVVMLIGLVCIVRRN